MEENASSTPSAKANNKSMLMIGAFVVIVLLVLGGVYVMNKSKSSDDKMAQTNISPTEAEGSMMDQTEDAGMMKTEDTTMSDSSKSGNSKMMDDKSAMKEETFNVVGSNFKFNMTTITVKKGETVNIVFASQGGMHDWVVDEFNARTKVVSSGQTDTISFVAAKTGTFEYYCSVGNHRQMGMVGKLIVQ
jgi:plastocyanin